MSNLHRALAQSLIENHHASPPRLAIEKRPFQNFHSEHFFKAEGLRAELDIIGIRTFVRPPFLIFHRVRFPHCPIPAELHDISFTVESQPGRTQFKIGDDLHAVTHAAAPSVGSFVHHPPKCSMTVFLPYLFEVDECALPWAESVVLERRQHDIHVTASS